MCSEIDASWKLGSTCKSVWPSLACSCSDLQWLVLTLVKMKFARKSTQVFNRVTTQPKSMQVEWRPLCRSGKYPYPQRKGIKFQPFINVVQFLLKDWQKEHGWNWDHTFVVNANTLMMKANFKANLYINGQR